MGGVLALAVLAQLGQERDAPYRSHYGWPMEVAIRDDASSLFAPINSWSYSPPPPRPLLPSTFQWNWQGGRFNAVFFTAMLIAVAIVVERLIRHWLNLWQFSLASLLWISSVFGATIAIVSQDYLPFIIDCFQYLHLKPRSELNLSMGVRVPIYFGMACLLYVIADSAFRAAVAAIVWWRQSKFKARPASLRGYEASSVARKQ